VQVGVSDTNGGSHHILRLNSISRKTSRITGRSPSVFSRRYTSIVVSRGLGFVALASHGSDVIAGGVFFHFEKKALYKYGASLFGKQHLRAK